jgi:phage/plasmid-like protein (TIGR03299 family)
MLKESRMFRQVPGSGIVTPQLSCPPPRAAGEGLAKRRDAAFLGWQKGLSNDIFPLYNILKPGHPSFKSTVTDRTLRAQHLQIPRTPSPYTGVNHPPWHDLGTELDNPATSGEALEAAGLDCTPAFAFFDNLIGTDEAIIETAGSLGRGEVVWILAKLPGIIKVHGNDIINKYLLLSSSHDGSPLVRVKLTPVRVVCNNTLTAALQGAGEAQIRHTPDASENLKQALLLLGLANHLYEQLDAIFNRMALTKIDDRQLRDYVNALVPDEEHEGDNEEIRGIRKACVELYESGQGADLSRGTLWGAFNCVTEYTDHVMESDPAGRLESIWFGRGEQLKLKAFQMAGQMM